MKVTYYELSFVGSVTLYLFCSVFTASNTNLKYTESYIEVFILVTPHFLISSWQVNITLERCISST